MKKYCQSTDINILSNPNESMTHHFVEFFKEIFLPKSNPTIYMVESLSCIGKNIKTATIESFAPVEWDGEISVGYSYETHKDSNFNQNQGWKKLKVHGQWELDGSISIKRNSSTWKLGATGDKDGAHNKDHSATKHIFNKLQSFLNTVAPHIGSIKSDLMDISFDWPNLSLGGYYKNIELKNSYLVSSEYEIKIDFNPLFGIKADAKILNWLISVVPGYGQFILKVKDKLEKGIGSKKVNFQSDINIDSIADATIVATLTWTKDINGKWNSKTEGLTEPKITLTMKGIIDAKLKVFVIKIAGGLMAYAESALSVKLKAGMNNFSRPTFGSQFVFSGLTLYWSYFYEVGSSEIHQGQHSNNPPKKMHLEKSSFHKEYKNKYEIFKPSVWPKEYNEPELSGDNL